MIIKHLNKTINDGELKKKIYNYSLYIDEIVSDNKLVIDVNNPFDFIAISLAAFKCGKTIKITDNIDKCKDIVFTDNNLKKDENDNFYYIYDLSEVVDKEEENILEIKAKYIVFCNGNKEKVIEIDKLLNFLKFHKNILRVNLKKCFYYFKSKTELESFIWLLPIVNGEEVTFSSDIEEFIDSYEKLIFIPVNEISNNSKLLNKDNYTIISYGDDIFDYKLKNIEFREKNIKWFNYFSFPFVTWLSQGKNVVLNGESKIKHSIKPIKGISLTVKDENGNVIPKNREGIVYESFLNNDYKVTNYKGLINSNDELIITSYVDGTFYKKGKYLNESNIENVCNEYKAISDYYIENDILYYCSKENIDSEIGDYFKNKLSKEYFPIDFIRVPNINKEYIKEKLAGTEEFNNFRKEIKDEGINACGTMTYENIGPSFELDNDKEVVKKTTEIKIKNKEALISGGDSLKMPYKDLCELLKARSNSNELIIYYEEDSIKKQSYSELYHNACKLASGLKKQGVKKGDKVIIQIGKRKEYVESFWACMLIGAAIAPMTLIDNFGTRNANTDKLYNVWNLLSKPVVLHMASSTKDFSKLKHSEKFNDLVNIEIDNLYDDEELTDFYNWNYDETCLILFTSGSTGVPKGVQLTTRNIFARTLGEINKFNLDKNNVDVNWMTLTHAAGLIWSHIRDVYMNILQIQVSTDYVLKSPLKLIDLFHKYKGTITWAPNFAYALIADSIDENHDYGWNLENFKYAFASGEANISKSLRRFLFKLSKYGLKDNVIIPALGITETSSCITYYTKFSLSNSSDIDEFIPAGEPMAGTILRITDEDGKILKEGEIGIVQGKGPTFTKGYYKNEKANKESFTKDGFLITGDLGYIDDGQLVLTGRINDVIIVNGLNYYVQDIESVTDEIEEVSFSIATSVHDNEYGDRLIVFYVPKNEELLDPENLEDLRNLNKKIQKIIVEKAKINPYYLIPAKSTELARTELGKKQRALYRKEFISGKYNNVLKLLRDKEEEKNKGYVLKEVFVDKSIISLNDYSVNKNISIISKLQETKNMVSNWNVKFELAEIDKDNSYEKSDIIVDFFGYEINENSKLKEVTMNMLKHGRMYSSLKKGATCYIISKFGSGFFNDEKINVYNTMLRGFLKSVALENPYVNFKFIDVDDVSGNSILNEIKSNSRDFEVIYRKNKRYVSKLESVNILDTKNKLDLNEKVVLVLGGLGGVGTVLCKHLLKKYNVKLIILGSSEINSEKQKKIDELNNISSTNVIYRSVDLNTASNLSYVVETCEKEIGEKVQVFFNLAGKISVSKDGGKHFDNLEKHMVKYESEYSLLNTLVPKFIGTLEIEKLRKERKNASLVLFSSVNGYFGGTSLGSYSAANSMMHTYGEWKSVTDPNIYTIDWSTWKDIGIMDEMPEALKNASINNGFMAFSKEENLKYLDYIISHGIQNSIVGVNRNDEKLFDIINDSYKAIVDIYYEGNNKDLIKDRAREYFNNKLIIRYNELDKIPFVDNNDNNIDWKSIYRSFKNKSTSNNEDLSETEKKVLKVWKEVLKIKDLGIDEDFFDCGGDSIVISKLSFRLKQEFNKQVNFQDILQNSTVRKCADLLEEKQKNVDFNEIKQEVEKELVLKYPIEDYVKNAREQQGYKEILLTGATGFLGAFMLAKLCEDKKITIHLLVRAEDDEKALERVKNNLAKYKLLSKVNFNQVKCHTGDIKLKNLGLKDNVYDELSKKVDTIYHSASVVNFAVNFHALANPNVNGVREIIKLASLNVIKTIHYISSFTIYSAMIQEKHNINENTKLLFETSVVNEYNKSKWIADNLVQMAKEKNIPAKIYRIGTLSGDTTNGICQTRDFMWLMIKVILTLRKAPILPMFGYNPVPVDIMANTIIDLSKVKYDKNESIYNLIFQTINMDKLVSWLRNIDESIEVISYTDWRNELIKYTEEKDDKSLMSILAVVPKPEIIENRTEQRVNSDLTLRIMKENNIPNVGETFESFFKTYKYMKSIGFFN